MVYYGQCRFDVIISLINGFFVYDRVMSTVWHESAGRLSLTSYSVTVFNGHLLLGGETHLHGTMVGEYVGLYVKMRDYWLSYGPVIIVDVV